MRSTQKISRRGLSLLELLAVVTLIGILAVIIVPRFSSPSVDAKRNACFVNKHNIEVQCQLWMRQKNAAPRADLTDVASDRSYFPEGLPTCPVDNSTYTINQSTQRVVGHTH